MNSHIVALNALENTNYLDSGLIGFSVDIISVKLYIIAQISSDFVDFSSKEGFAFICYEFRQISNLEINFQTTLSPPYLEDGSLAAMDLADFQSEFISAKCVGKTTETDRIYQYRDPCEIYEIFMDTSRGTIKFQFAEINLSQFDPYKIDSRNIL
jgi:hypothetical protein